MAKKSGSIIKLVGTESGSLELVKSEPTNVVPQLKDLQEAVGGFHRTYVYGFVAGEQHPLADGICERGRHADWSSHHG